MCACGVASGCSSGADTSACPTPTPAASPELGLLPRGLTLDTVGTVTRVVSTQGHVTVRAVTSKPIDEVTVALQDAVTAAGFRPAGMDNEGFEAEISFIDRKEHNVNFTLRQTDCKGEVSVFVLIEDRGSE